MKHKKLTRTCGLTIPKDMRAIYGMSAMQAVDLVEQEDGILIRKHVPSCFCCDSIDEVTRFKGFEICEPCRRELASSD